MRMVIAAVLALGSLGASAQVVYKCVGADGSISYQSNSCRPGDVAKDAWSAANRDPTPAENARRQRQEAANSRYLRNLAERHRQTRGSAAVLVSPNGPGTRCAAAKAARDRAYESTRKMSLDTMDRWANHVNAACGY